MMWFLLIVLVILLEPLAIGFLRRRPMNAAAQAQAPGQFADLPSGKTHYQWKGPQDGPVAVCVHGLTTPSYVWGAIVQGLTLMDYRVLTYDLYGRGYSDRVGGSQNAEFFNRQLEELLEDQGIDGGIMLLGYSMGGAIVTCYGAKHPDMLERLVLIAPAGFGIVRDRMTNFIINTHVLGDWLILVFGGSSLRKGIRRDSDIPSEVPDIYAMQKADTYVRGFLPALLSSLRNLLANTLEDEHKLLAVSDVPVAVIWGEADTVIPLSGHDKLAKINPTARQTTIPNAPHSLTYTYPREVIAAIQKFLREV